MQGLWGSYGQPDVGKQSASLFQEMQEMWQRGQGNRINKCGGSMITKEKQKELKKATADWDKANARIRELEAQ